MVKIFIAYILTGPKVLDEYFMMNLEGREFLR